VVPCRKRVLHELIDHWNDSQKGMSSEWQVKGIDGCNPHLECIPCPTHVQEVLQIDQYVIYRGSKGIFTSCTAPVRKMLPAVLV
jgi:hypothetical protein